MDPFETSRYLTTLSTAAIAATSPVDGWKPGKLQVLTGEGSKIGANLSWSSASEDWVKGGLFMHQFGTNLHGRGMSSKYETLFRHLLTMFRIQILVQCNPDLCIDYLTHMHNNLFHDALRLPWELRQTPCNPPKTWSQLAPLTGDGSESTKRGGKILRTYWQPCQPQIYKYCTLATVWQSLGFSSRAVQRGTNSMAACNQLWKCWQSLVTN